MQVEVVSVSCPDESLLESASSIQVVTDVTSAALEPPACPTNPAGRTIFTCTIPEVHDV